MELIDRQGFTGEVRMLVLDGDIDPSRAAAIVDDPGAPERARLVDECLFTNLVVHGGLVQMTKLIVAETTALASYVGLSTTAITPAVADTSLPNEISRQAISVRQSYSNTYQRYVAVFTSASFASTGIAASGIFDTASTGGTMWADASISVSKSATQSLIYDHRIQATT